MICHHRTKGVFCRLRPTDLCQITLISTRSHSYHEQGLGSGGTQPANRQRRQREELGEAEGNIQFRHKELGQQAGKPGRSSQGELGRTAFCRCCVLLCPRDPIVLGSTHCKIQPSWLLLTSGAAQARWQPAPSESSQCVLDCPHPRADALPPLQTQMLRNTRSSLVSSHSGSCRLWWWLELQARGHDLAPTLYLAQGMGTSGTGQGWLVTQRLHRTK